MAGPSIEDLLRSCDRSAVHLEMPDAYMPSDPMFIEWQAGHRYVAADRSSWWRPWLQLIKEITERGVEVRRARIVSEPVSEYIRFEYDITFTNLAAGERVRWLSRRNATGLPLPGNDFWLFDDRPVLVNHFTGEGESALQETTVDPDIVKLCASAFEAVWERAIPHEAYSPL